MVPPSDDLATLQRRHDELQLLYETVRDVSGTLSVREVLERLLRRVLIHVDAEIGSVLVLSRDGNLRIAGSRGLPTEIVEQTSLGIGEGISGWVIENGEPLLVEDVEADARFRRRNHERYYTSSFISAPLVHMGRAQGVINVNNKRSRAPFRTDDLALLEALAVHASAALANAHRYEALLDRAQRDSLTGLANHGHFWTTLELEFERAARHARPLSLVMLDIDHFKAFNDRFGHIAGDEALCGVARSIELHSRAHDVVARYGGEEFAAILPETDLQGALMYAEKMRGAVESARLLHGGEPLTVSAGVAATSREVYTPQALVSLADGCLYLAKQAGRNRVCGEGT
ncbi:MAG: sensor domain-containing diguanylate cyclase [Myxococcota bacterium]|nr:sensor domain-containing diguanylate cyclase [Myxococcota bacterium]